MRNKILIITLTFFLFFNIATIAYASGTGNYTYQNEEYDYSMSLPGEWVEVPQDYINNTFKNQAEFQQYNIKGFHLKDKLYTNPPYFYIFASGNDNSEYALFSRIIDMSLSDSENAKKELEQLINNSYDAYNLDVEINHIEIDNKNKRIKQEKTVNYGNLKLIQFTYNFIFEDALITLDFWTTEDESGKYEPIFQSIINSFEYSSDAEDEQASNITSDEDKYGKVVFMGSYKDSNLENPSFIFDHTIKKIFVFIELKELLNGNLKTKWYHFENGEKKLINENEEIVEDVINITAMIERNDSSFETGKWELEVVTDDFTQSIPFIVTDKKISNPINIYIDGIQQVFDQYPQVINGNTMVPMRGIFEKLGATVEWNGATETVLANKGDTVIELPIGKETATVNGVEVKLTQKAQVINGSTMVPLRFVSEALGAEVKWDGVTQSIYINNN